jgi:membrane dipeptidase
MVNFFAAFLSDEWRAGWNAQKPEMLAALDAARAGLAEQGKPMTFFTELEVEREYARRIPPAPFSVLVDHFDHLLRLVGPEHVGIGSDFDGIALSVEGMETATDLPKITAGLLQRGWKPEELRGMLGENLLRVMGTVQAGSGTA